MGASVPEEMPGEGLEPSRPLWAPGFKPSASTSSATPAGGVSGYRLHRPEERGDARPVVYEGAVRKRGQERV